jgi:hypothetical protein
MKTVHKVEIPMTPFPMPVRIPRSAAILHIAQQYPHSSVLAVSAWFEIEVGTEVAEDDARIVAAYGTGVYIPDEAVYLSTHVLDSGRLVLHLYELAEPQGALE